MNNVNRLNARQLRTQEPKREIIKKIKRNPIYIALDNVLDTYNVGAIFRLADAVAAEKIFLCGETETPPNSKIKKASINTWRWVEWEYAETTLKALQQLTLRRSLSRAESRGSGQAINNQQLTIIAVEQHSKSIPLSKLKPEFPVAVVVGNETYGVSKEVLELADVIVELPMFGVNKSLNVMVSCGIVLYKIVEFLPKS